MKIKENSKEINASLLNSYKTVILRRFVSFVGASFELFRNELQSHK